MNYTTYYRKDIWERFKDEPDKAALVNGLLEKHYETGGFSEVPVKVESEIYPATGNTVTSTAHTQRVADLQTVIDKIEPGPSDVSPSAPTAVGLPCCDKKTPCKHWQWNYDQAAYINTLTGEVRDPEL